MNGADQLDGVIAERLPAPRSSPARRPGNPFRPPMAEIWMMCRDRCARMTGSAARVAWMTPPQIRVDLRLEVMKRGFLETR